ncbi:hypothetical protein BDA99DRAFT_508452 [Phascolomyces articulosus]|uniref:Globin domain-containing protein n=1 Tax=Phascolomyces articulosus TaxID=60185 RepID=A0AAD5PFW8_9FUNG|nr:hypothetical protein BDA99DRAFT_508452 [Phascolomyces articulosus]
MAPPSPSPPTKSQTQLIRRTWERVSEKRLEKDNPNVSASYAFGKTFYESLFALEPKLKPIFNNSLQQARVLTGILSYITRTPSVMPARYKEIGTIRDMNAMMGHGDDDEDVEDSDDLLEELNKEEEAWMVERIQELGARHADYKIFQESFFDPVGPALVEAVQKRLGNEYEPHIGEAWLKAHHYVAFHMKKGLQSRLVWEEALADDQQLHYRKLHSHRRRSSGASQGSAAKVNNCSIQ